MRREKRSSVGRSVSSMNESGTSNKTNHLNESLLASRDVGVMCMTCVTHGGCVCVHAHKVGMCVDVHECVTFPPRLHMRA